MKPYANHTAVIRRLIRASAFHRAEKVLHKIPPADVAMVVEDLGPADAKPLCVYLLASVRVHKTLRLIPSDDWGALFEPLTDRQILGVFEQMPQGKIKTVIDTLPLERRDFLLNGSKKGVHEGQTAGSLMGKHSISMVLAATAQEAVQSIRENEHRDDIFYLYVTEADGRLAGVVPLRRLVTCEAATPLSELMSPEPVAVQLDTPAEQAARILGERGLLALPVTDAKRRLSGVLNADDVFELLASPSNINEGPDSPRGEEAASPKESGWGSLLGFFSPKRVRNARANKAAVVGIVLLGMSQYLQS